MNTTRKKWAQLSPVHREAFPKPTKQTNRHCRRRRFCFPFLKLQVINSKANNIVIGSFAPLSELSDLSEIVG